MWVDVELEAEIYAKELFIVLRHVINEQGVLKAVHREGTTISLEMTIKPDAEDPRAEC